VASGRHEQRPGAEAGLLRLARAPAGAAGRSATCKIGSANIQRYAGAHAASAGEGGGQRDRVDSGAAEIASGTVSSAAAFGPAVRPVQYAPVRPDDSARTAPPPLGRRERRPAAEDGAVSPPRLARVGLGRLDAAVIASIRPRRRSRRERGRRCGVWGGGPADSARVAFPPAIPCAPTPPPWAGRWRAT
jgi:hypothetical protein